jgi:hypothetical protein
MTSRLQRRGAREEGSPSIFANRQGFPHHVVVIGVLEAGQVSQLASEDRQEIHPVLLALVAGQAELGILPRCRVDEPAPAGVVIQPEGVAVRQGEQVAAQVGHADLNGT